MAPSERRAAVRLQTGGPASIEGHQGHVLDISIGGAMVRCEQPSDHHKAPLEIELECAGQEIALLGEERGRQTLPDGSAIVRLKFLEQHAPHADALDSAGLRDLDVERLCGVCQAHVVAVEAFEVISEAEGARQVKGVQRSKLDGV
jgi:hypothetical protein